MKRNISFFASFFKYFFFWRGKHVQEGLAFLGYRPVVTSASDSMMLAFAFNATIMLLNTNGGWLLGDPGQNSPISSSVWGDSHVRKCCEMNYNICLRYVHFLFITFLLKLLMLNLASTSNCYIFHISFRWLWFNLQYSIHSGQSRWFHFENNIYYHSLQLQLLLSRALSPFLLTMQSKCKKKNETLNLKNVNKAALTILNRPINYVNNFRHVKRLMLLWK